MFFPLQELLSLIELDIVSFTMFDLPPLSEYDLYVKKFGSNVSRQMAVQTGEDNLEQETQTDSIRMSSIWTQWPPSDSKGYGRKEDERKEEHVKIEGGSTIKLVTFLKRACQVCDTT